MEKVQILLHTLNKEHQNIDYDVLNKLTNDKNSIKKYVGIICNSRFNAPTKVLMSAVLSKLCFNEWDTRLHQKQLGGLYSIRTIDAKYVSFNLHQLGLVATNTPGALTRSFEKMEPYTLQYSGNIKPAECKTAFLQLLDIVNEHYNEQLCKHIVKYILLLLNQRHQHDLDIIDKFSNLKICKSVSISTIKTLFDKMYEIRSGISVLSPLIIHTIAKVVYPLLFDDVLVKDLKEHTCADKMKSLGDVEIIDKQQVIQGIIEVKHNMNIDDAMINTFRDKIASHSPRFSYILTSKNITEQIEEPNIVITNVLSFTTNLLNIATIKNKDVCQIYAEELCKNISCYHNLNVNIKQKLCHIIREVLD